ncbi:MAG TPA: beta-galactosidase GalA [Abditibacterium sp.]|jgi:beta-galactosidase
MFKPPFSFLAVGATLAAGTFMPPSPAAQAQTSGKPATPGRQKFRMDSGWRFFLGDFGDSSPSSGVPVILWKWKTAPADAATTSDTLIKTLDTTDAAWVDLAPGQDTFGGQPGFQWYQAILGNLADANPILHFDNVDDNAVVYLNGQRLLRHEGWDEPFDVPLKAAWKPGGPNVLVVLVQNTGGGGNVGPTFLRSGTPAAAPKPEVAPAAAKANFNDSTWRPVHLPHDFVVEGKFDPRGEISHGALPTGVGWYRKSFTLPASDKGKQLWLDFDGIYRNSKIWLNGKLLGTHPSGYIGVRYDITNTANYGGKNILTVRADARSAEGWWYEGGGIYRHVWLTKANKLHVAPLGTFATSQAVGSESNPQSAIVTVQTEVTNDGATPSPLRLVSLVQDAAGKTVASASSALTIGAGKTVKLSQKATVAKPRLWSVETPYLYRVVSQIQKGSQILDSSSVPHGIRTLRFDADTGFYLNGKAVKLKGTCNHQDHAGVGVAMPDSLMDWRIKQLKLMGSNAYRCSHNPVATELLEACDRQGMLVMDETRHLGDAVRAKSNNSTTFSDLYEVKTMVKRDRNHPSIILYSMANEEFGLQPTQHGLDIINAMKKATKAIDPTRLVTAAINGVWDRGMARGLEVQGFNYNIGAYDRHRRAFPTELLTAAETASAVSTRGIYENDRVKTYVSAYDLNHPAWGATAETAWKAVADRPWMSGTFVWTGFDYKGEPTPYAWPSINSHFGILDICGFPKDTFYYYQAWWGNKPVAHILPHWNWPAKQGQPISVWVHSNAQEVELFLNGQSQGRKPMPRNSHLEWSVNYAPGKLEARGYNGTQVVARDVVETAGAPAKLRLSTDRTTLQADNEDCAVVKVEVLDAQNRVVPTASNRVTFAITSKGKIGGVGNGDPASHEPDKANNRSAFSGLAMVLVQANAPGAVRLRATSPGLAPMELTFGAKAPTGLPELK